MKKAFVYLCIIISLSTLSGCSESLSDKRTVATVNGGNIALGELKYWMCAGLQYLGYNAGYESINWTTMVTDDYPLGPTYSIRPWIRQYITRY